MLQQIHEHKWAENGESYALLRNRGETVGWIVIGFAYPLDEELTEFQVLDAVGTPLNTNASSLGHAEEMLFEYYS